MKNKGFTIVELVITIFVLSIAVIGVYNAFSILLISTTETINRFTAAYLAQEGVEIVRNIRDTNWLKADTDSESFHWDDGLADCGESVGGCEADYTTDGTSTNPLVPFGSDGRYLNIDADGFYSYNSSGTPTKFKRSIAIKQINDNTMEVLVQVAWSEKPNILNSDRSSGLLYTMSPLISLFVSSPNLQGGIVVHEYLYNWY